MSKYHGKMHELRTLCVDALVLPAVHILFYRHVLYLKSPNPTPLPHVMGRQRNFGKDKFVLNNLGLLPWIFK